MVREELRGPSRSVLQPRYRERCVLGMEFSAWVPLVLLPDYFLMIVFWYCRCAGLISFGLKYVVGVREVCACAVKAKVARGESLYTTFRS